MFLPKSSLLARALWITLISCCVALPSYGDLIFLGGNVVNQKGSGNLNYDTNNDGVMDLVMDTQGYLGIETTAPSGNLHLVGNIFIIDGNEANNYVLASDGNGMGTWTDVNTLVTSSPWTTSSSNIYFDSANVGIGDLTPAANLVVMGNAIFSSDDTDETPLIARGADSHSGNLQEWQDSGGNVLTYVGSTGKLRVGGQFGVTGAFVQDNGVSEVNISYDPATNIGLLQSATWAAAFREMQYKASIHKFFLTSTETVRIAGGIVYNNSFTVNGALTFTAGIKHRFETATTTDKVLAIKGASAHTASLQEWQGSAGNILSLVTADGRFHIGGDTTPSANLHVSGNSYFDDGIVVGNNIMPSGNDLYDIGSATESFNDIYVDNLVMTSDRRKKTDVSDIAYGLSEILELRPVSFRWKQRPQSEKRLGLIAQEVKPHIGEIVKGKEQSSMGVQYVDLVPVLIKALQEQHELSKSQHDELRKEIDELRRSLKTLSKSR